MLTLVAVISVGKDVFCMAHCMDPDSARDDDYNNDTRKIIRKPSRQTNIATMPMSLLCTVA